MSNSGSDNDAKSNEKNQHAHWAEEQRRKREDDEIINEYLTEIRQQRVIKTANGEISMYEKGVIDHLRLIRERDSNDHSNYMASKNRASRSYSLDEQERDDFKFDESIVAPIAQQLRYMKEGYYGDVDYGDEDFEENYEDEEEEDEEEDDEEKDEDEKAEEEEDDQD